MNAMSEAFRPLTLVISSACACLVSHAIADDGLSATEALRFAARQADGASEVIRIASLTEDHRRGVIDGSDLLRELVEDDPVLATALIAHYGDLSECFLLDLLFAETNGSIGSSSDGAPLYFATSQFLDQSGSVLPGRTREYNAARRANKILQEALAA